MFFLLLLPGFAISKYPGPKSEYLVRQANDKLHSERLKFRSEEECAYHWPGESSTHTYMYHVQYRYVHV